jgi:segregation and condensation protein B
MTTHPLARRPAAVRAPTIRPANRRLLPALRDGARADRLEGGEFFRDRPLAAVEAALFLADEPLTARTLAALAGLTDAGEARQQAERLAGLLQSEGSAFQLEELAGGYQLLTRPEFHPWLARLRQGAAEARLSAAARETLTIIAYRQPITRADVEAIRGVGVAEVLRQLMERGLVKIGGRDDSLGRPALYQTTPKFLQALGLKSLADLPPGEGLFRSGESKPDATARPD